MSKASEKTKMVKAICKEFFDGRGDKPLPDILRKHLTPLYEELRIAKAEDEDIRAEFVETTTKDLEVLAEVVVEYFDAKVAAANAESVDEMSALLFRSIDKERDLKARVGYDLNCKVRPRFATGPDSLKTPRA